MGFRTTAKKIATAIEDDLTGRSGMDWDSIDEDTANEIRNEWERIILDILAKGRTDRTAD